jgi:cytochrome c biogenesis protein CcmG, thiol:disulfide interchange protein DsbE
VAAQDGHQLQFLGHRNAGAPSPGAAATCGPASSDVAASLIAPLPLVSIASAAERRSQRIAELQRCFMNRSGLSAARLVPLFIGIAALAAAPAKAAPETGEAAPALVLTGFDGNTFDLAGLRGKVVLVNYWATWCAPCRKEMPTLDAFYRRYHAQGLEMIGISIDFSRDLEKARRMAKTVSYPAAHTGGITDNSFGTPTAVPVTYVIGANGVVRDRFIATPEKLLRDVVVPLLPHAESSR